MIGKYSSLACSNTVYITSYYEGIAYYYVMVKSGNSITTNLLMEQPTQEKNGVEVTIKNITKIDLFIKALQCIVFFPNIYIDGIHAEDINSAKLKRFNNFAVASITTRPKLLLGNVLYPIQNYHLNINSVKFLNSIIDTGIVIKFNVGEINITPNRENIIYSSDTIKKIEDRIAAAKLELETMIINIINKDYDDIIEYFNAVAKSYRYDPLTSTITKQPNGYLFSPLDLTDSLITYKGVDLKKRITNIRNVLNMTLPNFKGVVCDDKIFTKISNYVNIRYSHKISTSKLLILNAGARLIASAKFYLKEKYNDYAIITDISEFEFLEWVKKEVGSLDLGTSDNLDFILTSIYQSMMKKAVRLDLNTDSEFLAYKISLNANKSIDIKDAREVILYIWNNNGYRRKTYFKKFSEAVSYIKSLKKGVILTNMDADDYLLSDLAKFKDYVYIKARKDVVADLREMKLKCLVDFDWLTTKDPTLSIVKTIIKHFPKRIDTALLQGVINNISKDLQKEFLRLYHINDTFGSSSNYRSLVLTDKIPYDSYTEYLCLKLKSYLTEQEKATALVNTIGVYDKSTLTTAVLVKTKAYRVSNEAYNRFKSNPLLKVLCKK